ncbi:1071_t:CDS:1, partial [Entrophospora sp. SA101]
KLARKYLGISTMSFPAEWLFSDAGNHITPMRNKLKPDRVE